MSELNQVGAENVQPAQALTHALFDLSSAIDLIGRASADRLGINQTDLICLHLLVREGAMSPSRVAAELGLTAAAISALATRLEVAGYAHREMDPNDRRRVVISASEQGARSAFGMFDDLYAASVRLGKEQTDAELRKLVQVITRFGQIVTEQAAGLRRR